MATPHNKAAAIGDIAKTVLLAGDPLRALYVAEKYFTDVRKITDTRNMLGFTGTWNNIPITVMGSGMGGPSIGIYSYELYTEYNVENIIRIGTSGGLQEQLEPGDLVFAMTASTDSNWAHQYKLPGTFSPCATYNLLSKAINKANEHNFRYHVGSIFSSDLFSSYNALNVTTDEESWKPWARMGCLAQDMETYALYSTAAWLNKKALTILTHTDSCVTGKSLADNQRITALEPMFIVALETALSIN